MRRRSLYFVDRGKVEVREEELAPPGPGQVLVEARTSAVSAGTEMLFYHGLVPSGIKLDVNISSLQGTFSYPFKYGYSSAGKVIAAGSAEGKGLIGRSVFCFHPHESHYIASLDDILPIPEGISLEDAAMLASMETGLSLVMDGRPLPGEDVVVLGQGVIGLLTTSVLAQMALGSLLTVDAFPMRRGLSMQMGATVAVDPSSPPEGLVRSHGLGEGKADLVFEISGNPVALEYAIRAAGFEGRVVLASWYGTKAAVVHFGEDFHRNRIQLIASQVSSIGPDLSGRWSKSRRLGFAWKMVRSIRPSRLVTHRVPFEDAASVYSLLESDPEKVGQILLTYGKG